MKLILIIFSFSAWCLFISCSQKPKNGQWEIKTNLVNGTIKADNTKLIDCGGRYERTEDGYSVTYEFGCIECDEFRITIDTTFLSLEDYSKRFKESVTVIEEERGENYRLFYIKYLDTINRTKVFGNTISADSVFTKGYKFFVFKRGENKNYVLEGNNELYSKSAPIYDKEIAMKALAIAQSFNPTD